MSRAVLDTSILIAREQQRPLIRPLPENVAVSVISVAELELGVLLARDSNIRAAHPRTLGEVRSLMGALPVDERTSSAYTEPAAGVISAGRQPRVNDTWIAATAMVNGAEVWTQDSDFSDFDQAVTVIRA